MNRGNSLMIMGIRHSTMMIMYLVANMMTELAIVMWRTLAHLFLSLARLVSNFSA